MALPENTVPPDCMAVDDKETLGCMGQQSDKEPRDDKDLLGCMEPHGGDLVPPDDRTVPLVPPMHTELRPDMAPYRGRCRRGA